METLTKSQRLVLDEIKKFIQDHSYPPTHLEICQALGYRSPNSTREHLEHLERKGWIRRTPGVSRGIVVLGGSEELAG